MQNQEIADRYLRFARNEARGQSPMYEELALHVATSPSALAFLSKLPKDRQQPNLLFAALRFAAGTDVVAGAFDDMLVMHQTEIDHIMRTRTTQTNEPGRCAALMPVLSQIDGPLALIEIGASAGLCLLPDAYGYDWGVHTLSPPDQGPVFSCTVYGDVPLPNHHLDIQWRAGLDLNPLDVTSTADVDWLEQLVWPEHHTRRARLKEAIAVAQRKPPAVHRGNLLHDLNDLVSTVPKGLNIVVFHTAVLAYVPDLTVRNTFAAEMTGHSDITWVSNEGRLVFPQISTKTTEARDDMFLISKNGTPVAWSAPHGQSLIWL